MNLLPNAIIVKILMMVADDDNVISSKLLLEWSTVCRRFHGALFVSEHSEPIWRTCMRGTLQQNSTKRLEIIERAVSKVPSFQRPWFGACQRLWMRWGLIDDHFPMGGYDYALYGSVDDPHSVISRIQARALSIWDKETQISQSLKREFVYRSFVEAVDEDVKRKRLMVKFGLRFVKNIHLQVVLETAKDSFSFPENFAKQIAEIAFIDSNGDSVCLLRHSYLNKTDCTCGCGPFFILTHGIQGRIVDTTAAVKQFQDLLRLEVPLKELGILLLRLISIASLFSVPVDESRLEHGEYLLKVNPTTVFGWK